MSCVHPIGYWTSWVKKTESLVNKDSITGATIHENLLKPLKELRSFLHHWLQLILVPSSILLPQVFSQCLYIFFSFHIFIHLGTFFFFSFYSKIWVYSIFYPYSFSSLCSKPRVFLFKLKQRRKGLVVYTGQICLMFQVEEMKSFLFFNRRIMWLFSKCGLADHWDKDHIWMWAIHVYNEGNSRWYIYCQTNFFPLRFRYL